MVHHEPHTLPQRGPIPSEELARLVVAVMLHARQHRRAVVAVGVSGAVPPPLQLSRHQIGVALDEQGLPDVSVTLSVREGPMQLEVIEFAP